MSHRIEKIRLRNKRDKFAARGKFTEITDWYSLTINDGPQFSQFLVRLFQKLIKQPEFVHQLERGRMNSVASEISIEIGVLFQDDHLYARSRE